MILCNVIHTVETELYWQFKSKVNEYNKKNDRINNEQNIERKPTRMVKDNEHIEDLNDQMLVRREKMNELREKGVDPFGSRYEPTHFSVDLVEEYDKFIKRRITRKRYPCKN